MLATATAMLAVDLGIDPHAGENRLLRSSCGLYVRYARERWQKAKISEESSSQQAGNGLSGTEEVRLDLRREKRGDKQNVLSVLQITCKGGEKKK